MSARRRARLRAFQILYRLDINPEPLRTVFDEFRQNGDLAEEDFAFAMELVAGARERLAELDGVIDASALHWRVARMGAADRNILRLGAYELLYRDDIPPAVAMDEAINLAKRFGDAESGRFVNGILDRIHHTAGRG